MNRQNVTQIITSMELLLAALKKEIELPAFVPVPDTSADSGGQKALLCPECSGDMMLRTNRSNGNKFWGCKKYPECKGTRDENGLSKAERDAEREKREKKEFPQTDGFSFTKTTAPTGWVNPFQK